MDNDREEPML